MRPKGRISDCGLEGSRVCAIPRVHSRQIDHGEANASRIAYKGALNLLNQLPCLVSLPLSLVQCTEV